MSTLLPVAIIGAGPVGLAAASRGESFVLFEATGSSSGNQFFSSL